MKQFFYLSFIVVLFAGCSNSRRSAKINYQVSQDAGEKILKGIINRSVLENDTSFKWFKENMKWGEANAAAVETFKKNKDKFTVVIFGGTWCHDTQNLLPVFYRLADKSGFPEKNITLIAVDRDKKTINNLQKNYSITNVPTFIIMKDGKEMGRVVEYGSSGEIDKELGEIVKKKVEGQ